MLSKKQVEAIQYLIIKSKNASDIAKQLCLFLIVQSESLTKKVCVSIKLEDGFSKEEVKAVHDGVHDMNSMNGSTHLSEVLSVAGVDSRFHHCSGVYDGSGKHNEKIKDSVTIWFCGHPSETDLCEIVSVKAAVIRSISLVPSLYGL